MIKFTAPSFGSSADFYTVSLGGASATAIYLGSSTEGSNTFSIYEWTWSGLNLPAGSSFEVTANGSADHVSMDAIQLGAVLEAASSLLGLLGVGGIVLRRRR